MIFFPLPLSLMEPLCGFDRSDAYPALCFFFSVTPMLVAELPMGPDQAWNGSFEKIYEVEPKETS